MKKIYISGPITGYDLEERMKTFQDAENFLSNKYAVVNPLKNGLPRSASYCQQMRMDIRLMMDCDEIAFLHGWEKSPGCQLEANIAAVVGMDTLHLDDF